MAITLLRRWRLATVPRIGRFYLHASTPAAGLLALIWTGESETLLAFIGLCLAALTHATGHMVAAKLRGELPRETTLYPAWTVTRMFQPPGRVVDDLLVTASGPLANGMLGATLLLAFDGPMNRQPEWLGQWARLQIGYGIAMLAPVFPLDGSRLLRLTLKLRYPESRAWEIAGFVGQATAAGIVFWSLVQGIWGLALLGILFYLAGRFSPMILEFGKRLQEAQRAEEDGWPAEKAEDGETITLTQTADGVWQQVGASPSNESLTYF